VEKFGKTCIVPKGSMVTIEPYYLHRDARHWPDPEVFKPEVLYLQIAVWLRISYNFFELRPNITIAIFENIKVQFWPN